MLDGLRTENFGTVSYISFLYVVQFVLTATAPALSASSLAIQEYVIIFSPSSHSSGKQSLLFDLVWTRL